MSLSFSLAVFSAPGTYRWSWTPPIDEGGGFRPRPRPTPNQFYRQSVVFVFIYSLRLNEPHIHTYIFEFIIISCSTRACWRSCPPARCLFVHVARRHRTPTHTQKKEEYEGNATRNADNYNSKPVKCIALSLQVRRNGSINEFLFVQATSHPVIEQWHNTKWKKANDN